jgi:hypothetical protein
MGRQYEAIDDDLAAWIGRQHLFFVGTAPNGPDGHVNISPKGSMATFRILGPRTVAYLDLTGSGIETAAHLRENGRIVLMFCAFDGPPKIVRLHGRGRVVQPHEPDFAGLLARFDPDADLRAVLRSVIVVAVERIADSCGFVVPRMDYASERRQLFRWADQQVQKRGDAWGLRYRQAHNRASIDGLPGLDFPDELSEDEARAWSSVGRAL